MAFDQAIAHKCFNATHYITQMRIALLTIVLLASSLQLAAQMSDAQVAEFARQSLAQGKSQTEIALALAQRGVTKEQLLRIRYNTTAGAVSAPSVGASDRSRMRSTTPQIQDSLPEVQVEAPAVEIFGHNVFRDKRLTFEPTLNIATPDNYLIGPGDEVIVDIWGDSEQTIRQTVSPDGTIVINRLGPVALNGLTVKEAEARLKRSLGRIYSAVDGIVPATFVKLSLGQLRSIQVHVMGEVANPGTYTVSSLASLFHVLYNAGGVNEIGSLRSIGISRGGKRVADADVYSYLLEGRTEVDIALNDGDVVMVAPYENLVTVAGGVKRPMKYEMKEGETLASLFNFSGGFKGDSYRNAVTVVRRNGRMQEVHNIGRSDYGKFPMADGDSVAVGSMIDRFANRLEISGAVFRPGLYAVSDSVATVGQLIAQAEGVRGDAFTHRAQLTREKADYTLEVMPVDVGGIISGSAPDIALRNGDVLHVPSIFDLREAYTVTIQGAVGVPGDYAFVENMAIEDMIIRAGGLLEAASTARVDVFRRIKNPASETESEERSESFSFAIRDGLVISEDEFILQPFDIVSIRTSPGYETQKSITIQGEVLFPGDYTLVQKNERLSDVVKRAGGTLASAYLRGASLVRQMGDDEQVRTQSTKKLTQLGGPDSLSMENLNISQTYLVGIELDKAMRNPGSDYDLVLEEGDVLRVPEYVGTVSVSGAVLYPNTVSYREGMSIGEYINQAGGYLRGARKAAKIVVYMNGTVTRTSVTRGTRIDPGSEIIVPYKSYRRGRLSVAEILSLGASATSTALLGTSLANSLK